MERIMKKLQLCVPAARLETAFEETGEAIVTDAMPDLSDVVDTAAQVMVREKSVQDGCLLVSGTILLNALCKAEEDGAVCSMEVPITFSQKLRAEQARSGMHAQVDARVTQAQGKLLSPRKLGVRTVVGLDVSLYSDSEESILEDVTGDESLALRKVPLEVSRVVSVQSKHFTVIGEPDVTQADVRDVLRRTVWVEKEEAEVGSGRISCKGTAVAELLYLDSRNMLRTWRTEIPFTQVLEQSGLTEEMEAVCSCSIRSMEFSQGEEEDEDAGTLTVTLGVTADLLLRVPDRYEVITDAYSTASELELTMREHMTSPRKEQYEQSWEIREEVETAVSRILQHRLIREGAAEDGELALRAELLMTQEDGTLQTIHYPFRAKVPGAQAGLVRVGQSSAAAQGDHVLLQATLLQRDEGSGCVQTTILEDLQELRPWERREEPELVLCFAAPQEELWPIAKRFRVMEETIRAANADAEPTDGAVLIPLMN